MTALHKSDAQLDAEAAGRIPVTERPLSELIEDHRALYRADLMLPRLHVSTGNGRTTATGKGDYGDSDEVGSPEMGGIGWTGVEFNHRFLRYIDWEDKDQEAGVRPSHPGAASPWSQAFYAQWADCRRYHPEHHGRPEWRGSLCRQLVSFTVRNEPPLSLESACLVLGVTPPRAGRSLRTALLWIESYMDRAHRRQKERARPLRERVLWRDPKDHERHGLGGIHAEDCPQCQNGVA